MTEKEIETQILTWLNYQPAVFAFKVNTVGIFDPVRRIYRRNKNKFVINGTSDIIGIAYGKFLAIEVKTPASMKRFIKTPTLADLNQITFLEKVRKQGGHAIVVSSLDQVSESLYSLKRELDAQLHF